MIGQRKKGVKERRALKMLQGNRGGNIKRSSFTKLSAQPVLIYTMFFYFICGAFGYVLY